MKQFEHITFITGNAGKYKEVAALMPGIKVLAIDLPEIQEINSIKIIAEKLAAALVRVKGPIIVDDTALYLECLGGQLPGPLVKWFAQTLKNSGLATLTQKLGNAQARATTLIGYAPDQTTMTFFEGSLSGTIVSPQQEAVANGHGWDNIFKPEGSDITFAAMDIAAKNAISPRAQAIRKLIAFLANQA